MESRFTVTVASKTTEADGICSYELVLPCGSMLPAFGAGAHVDVCLAGLPPRQYSLCNDPTERHRYVIGVLRAEKSRGVSDAMHDTISTGTELEISAPRNHFSLTPKAKRSVLLAGGIGVTPILAMAESLSSQGADFSLHYACRTRSRAAFLDRISSSTFATQANLYFDDEPELALDLAKVLANPAPDTHVYICGPEGLLEAARKVASGQGWAADNVHFEYFAGSNAQTDADSAFEIEIAETGEVVTVEKGQSALNALTAHGIDIPCSCEEGVCGMCMTPVLAGTPDHRDKFLSDSERARNDTFMPCCSRAKSARLVISV